MKTFLSTLLLSLFAYTLFAQDCKPYMPSSEGATWEITDYNAKGKIMGKTVYTLKSKTVSGNGITFVIASKTYDKKDKETFSNEFSAWCKNGVFEVDMSAKIPTQQMAAYQNMDINIDATNFELPDENASAGTTLKDGTLNAKIGSNGMTMMNMNVNITDRKVEKKESITTDAGTFDCLVLSQKMNMKMMVKIEASSKEWYAPGVGMVRSESYNKSGKMTGYSVLTKLNQ